MQSLAEFEEPGTGSQPAAAMAMIKVQTGNDMFDVPDLEEDGEEGVCLAEGLSLNKEDKKDILKRILTLAVPALGAVLSDPLMSLIDTGCVGQISAVQLAALGPNTSIFNFVFQAFEFLGMTTCNLVAHIGTTAVTLEEGRAHQLEASRVLSNALFLAVIVGLAVLLALELLAPQLLAMMGAKEEYFGPAITYLRIRSLSAPAVIILIVGQGAFMGRQDAKTPLAISFAAAICNFTGDMVLTLWARWGIAGAAWATCGAQCVAVCLLAKSLNGNLLHHKESVDGEHEPCVSETEGLDLPAALPFVVGWYGLPSQEALGPFIAMAGPLVIRSVLGMTIYTTMTKVAAETGTLEIAAHQVAMETFWTLSFFPDSLSVAAQSLIAKDVKLYPRRASKMARMLVTLSLVLGLVLAICVGAIHVFASSWFSSDAAVRQLVVSVTPQSMLSEILCAVAVVIEGIAIGAGDIAYFYRMQFINLAGVLSALALTYSAKWGLCGVWWCLVLYFGARIIYHCSHIWAHWEHNVLGAPAFDWDQGRISSI